MLKWPKSFPALAHFFVTSAKPTKQRSVKRLSTPYKYAGLEEKKPREDCQEWDDSVNEFVPTSII